MVNAFRYGMLGVSDVNVTFSIVMISFFIIVFYTISLYILKKGIGIRDYKDVCHNRRDGRVVECARLESG